MPNFFLENEDILFHFENLNIEEIVQIMENDYKESEIYNYAPTNYADALDNYKKKFRRTGKQRLRHNAK